MNNEGTGAAKPVAVLDSNVIISGFAFAGGNPNAIIDQLRQGEIQVYISPFIFEEVSRIWRTRFGWDESRIEEALLFLQTYCVVIDPPEEASVNELSSDDSRILDCAIHAGAQYLVTGDHDLQDLREYQGVSIVTPAEFLTLVRQGHESF